MHWATLVLLRALLDPMARLAANIAHIVDGHSPSAAPLSLLSKSLEHGHCKFEEVRKSLRQTQWQSRRMGRRRRLRRRQP